MLVTMLFLYDVYNVVESKTQELDAMTEEQ